jgi:hypothetical protein
VYVHAVSAPTSSCCSEDQGADALPCPRCEAGGPVIGHRPVRPHRPHAVEGDWRFCTTVECAVVYYLDNDVVTIDELRTQVDHKALDKPRPVCFCFSHTVDDLADDLVANRGTSTIKAEVKAAVADGFCACEHLNPSGKCCLADIHRALKSINAGTTTRPTI